MMSDTAMSDYEVSPDRRAFEVFKREILALWEEDKSEAATKERDLAKRMCALECHDPDTLLMGHGEEPQRCAGMVSLYLPIYPMWSRYLRLARLAIEANSP